MRQLPLALLLLAAACNGPEETKSWNVEEDEAGVAEAEPMPAPPARQAAAKPGGGGGEAAKAEPTAVPPPEGWPADLPTMFLEATELEGKWVVYEYCDAQAQRREVRGSEWWIHGGQDALSVPIAGITPTEQGVRIDLAEGGPVHLVRGPVEGQITLTEGTSPAKRWFRQGAAFETVVQPESDCGW